MKKLILLAAAAITALASFAEPGHKFTYRVLEESSADMADMNPMALNGVRQIEVYTSGNKAAIFDLDNHLTNIFDLDKGQIIVVAPRLKKGVARKYDAASADPMNALRKYGKVDETSDVTEYNGSRAIHNTTSANVFGSQIRNESLVLDTILVLPEAFHASLGFITKGGVPVKLSSQSAMKMNGKDLSMKQCTRLVKMEEVDVDPSVYEVPAGTNISSNIADIPTLLKENNNLPKDEDTNAIVVAIPAIPAFNEEWTF